MNAPFLITLAVDDATFRRLEALRQQYFPPERNVVPAHLSLFHQLPSDEQNAIVAALEHVAGSSPAVPLLFSRLKRLGGGMAIEVDAPLLRVLHARLAKAFEPWLTKQEQQPFRPHATIMNKATAESAATAFAELSARWSAFEGTGEALLLWRYLGGPWERVSRFELQKAVNPFGVSDT